MNIDDNAEDEFDEFDELEEKLSELSDQRRFRSEGELLKEYIERARGAKNVCALIRAWFRIANLGSSNGDHIEQRRASLELMALVESEEAARRVEPNVEESDYAYHRYTYTACAYDNLAIATAHLHGYNSEGMAGTVSEGIEKCRVTGKTSCVTCFHAYNIDVNRAADDLDYAIELASSLAYGRPSPINDRRCVGLRDLAMLWFQKGEPRRAADFLTDALPLDAHYHTPENARRSTHDEIAKVCLVLGDEELRSRLLTEFPQLSHVVSEAGEDPLTHRTASLLEALRLSCGGAFAESARVLRLVADEDDARQDLFQAFESRSRLAATLRLAGDEAASRELALETLEKARLARDWLTVRRLNRVLDPNEVVDPLANPYPFKEGIFAVDDDARSGDAERVDSEAEETASTLPAIEEESSEPSLLSFQSEWNRKLRDAEDVVAVATELAPELLRMRITILREDIGDAEIWMKLAARAAENGAEAAKLEAMGGRLLAMAQKNRGTLLPWYANLLDGWRRIAPGGAEDAPSIDRVREAYRASLARNVDSDLAHFNAGCFFQSVGDLGEAERCFARAARLDRTWPPPTLRLADLLGDSGRNSDALGVLDLAIRASCRDAGVAWKAGIAAWSLGKWERSISYFTLFGEIDPDAVWLDYYRAGSHVELEQYELALERIEREVERNPEIAWGGLSIKAMALIGLDRLDETAATLDRALEIPLREVTGLNRLGMLTCFNRLRGVAERLDDLRRLSALTRRAIRAGLLPDGYYREVRLAPGADRVPNVRAYDVPMEVALPEGWREEGDCPAWETEWTSYAVTWRVLAVDEDSAVALALEQQRRCEHGEPKLGDVSLESDAVYTDVPGVLGSSWRDGS